MYQVLARKWRPRTFDELVGQRHVTRTLSNAIESGRLAHAYIFAGLRGTGKTTVARIFASCLNAEDGPTVHPDPASTVAQEIAESRNMDVLELDAASRTSVDNIRELQEVIAYAPVRDRYKVLIIDEAHMLSKAAFNALLKTLEEPPPNVVFILATTELQKILPTILSRCQVFEFRRVPATELTAHLRKIADRESLQISDIALDRIARAGEGSVRDALSVLERVRAFCGESIEDEAVLRVLGAVQSEVLQSFVRGLAARDSAALLDVLDGLVDEGHDLVHFWNETIAVLRDLIYLRAAPGQVDRLTRAPAEAQALAACAEGLGVEDLSRAFQLLADLEPGLKASSQPRFLFEAALVRLAALGSVQPIEAFLSALESGDATLSETPAPVKKKSLGIAEPAGLKPGQPTAAATQPASSQPASPQPAPSQPASPQPASSQPASPQPASSQPASQQPTESDATAPPPPQPRASQPQSAQPQSAQPHPAASRTGTPKAEARPIPQAVSNPGPASPEPPHPASGPPAPPSAAGTPAGSATSPTEARGEATRPSDSVAAAQPQRPPSPASGNGTATAPTDGRALLRGLRQALADDNPFLGTVLEQATAAQTTDGRFTLRFDASQRAVARPLQRDTNIKRLEAILSQLGGQPLQLAVAFDETASAPVDGGRVAEQRQSPADLLQQARQEPGVRRLLREFGAQVLEIQPVAPEEGDSPAAEEIG